MSSPRTPLPGRPVRGSATGRPEMALLDLLGRRGAMRLLWELRDGHGQSFRLLRASAGDMSPSVLNTRLKELREAGLVAAGEAGYTLTESGRELVKLLKPLGRWAQHWGGQLAAQPAEPAPHAPALKRASAPQAAARPRSLTP
jgi:DNA-binding HxlR family transcriptional regulator